MDGGVSGLGPRVPAPDLRPERVPAGPADRPRGPDRIAARPGPGPASAIKAADWTRPQAGVSGLGEGSHRSYLKGFMDGLVSLNEVKPPLPGPFPESDANLPPRVFSLS